MGQRYEKNKKNVSENRRTIENLREEKNTLQNEYAPMSLLDSIESLLDDEVTDAVDEVRTVGQLESQRIETETDAADLEKEQIADEIGQEIAKLNAGLEKLRKPSSIEFGKRAIEQGSQEYKKQAERYKQLLDELGMNSEGTKSIDANRSGGKEELGYVFEEADSEQLEYDETESVREPVPIRANVRQLSATMQKTHIIDNHDGSYSKVFDHPDNLSSTLKCAQGDNELGKKGTCGLANTAQWLNVGGSDYTENDVVLYATQNELCSDTGGTIAENRAKIWEAFGMPAEVSYDIRISALADAVEEGRAVGIGVNAGLLWSNDNPENYDYSPYIGDGGSNHVIGVVSVKRNAVTDAIEGFYINDTGRGNAGITRDSCRFVPLQDFESAFRVPRSSACISNNPVW